MRKTTPWYFRGNQRIQHRYTKAQTTIDGAGMYQLSVYIERHAEAVDKTCQLHAAILFDLFYAAANPSYRKVFELAKPESLEFSGPTEK